MAETAQAAPETDNKKSRGLGSYLVWAFVVVMVYVLSSGPALRYEVHHFGTRRQRTLESIYGPLRKVYFNTPLWKPLGMYWHRWVPEMYFSNGAQHPYGLRVLTPGS